jgi:hypothetical protein
MFDIFKGNTPTDKPQWLNLLRFVWVVIKNYLSSGLDQWQKHDFVLGGSTLCVHVKNTDLLTADSCTYLTALRDRRPRFPPYNQPSYSENMNVGLALRSFYAFFALTSLSNETKVYTGFGGGDLKERDHSKDVGVDGRIILKLIFR